MLCMLARSFFTLKKWTQFSDNTAFPLGELWTIIVFKPSTIFLPISLPLKFSLPRSSEPSEQVTAHPAVRPFCRFVSVWPLCRPLTLFIIDQSRIYQLTRRYELEFISIIHAILSVDYVETRNYNPYFDKYIAWDLIGSKTMFQKLLFGRLYEAVGLYQMSCKISVGDRSVYYRTHYLLSPLRWWSLCGASVIRTRVFWKKSILSED